MKRQLFVRAWMLLLAAILAIPLAAQNVTVQVDQAGGLWDALEAQGVTNFAGIKSLKVTGKIGTNDFLLIKNQMNNLESVDIAETDVTEIPREAFNGKENLKIVRLPEDITNFHNEAFQSCHNLETVTFGDQAIASGKIVFPASLRYVEYNAFAYCNKLTHLDFTACTNWEGAGSSAFYGLYNLTEVSLPNKGNVRLDWNCFNVDNFWDDATQQWVYKGLEKLTLTKAVTYLSGYSLPRTLKTLFVESANPPRCDENTFSQFSEGDNISLKVYVPKGSKRNYALADGWSTIYQYMQEIGVQITINGYGSMQYGKLIYTDGDVFFMQDNAVTLKAIPEMGCELISVELDGTVLSVSADGSFNIPAGTSIGTLNLTFTANPLTVENPNGGELKDKIVTLGITPETLHTLKVTGKMNNKDWNYVKNNLSVLEMFDISETDVTTIPESAFSRKQKLNTVHLPTTLTSISSSAFYECPQLAIVDGCDNVQEIGSSAFYNCPLLSAFPFGNKIKKIESSAFCSCTSLPETLIMPASLNELGWSNVFSGSSIRNFDLSQCKLSSNFAYNAFGQCISLLLPEKEEYSLGDQALLNAQLTTLRLPVAVSGLWGGNVLPSTLQQLYVSRTEPIGVYTNTFDNIDFDNCTLYVPAGAADTYSETNTWMMFTNIREYGFKINVNGYGSLQEGNNTYGNADIIFATSGRAITLKAVPEPGCELLSVKLDDTDLSVGSDGSFTIPAGIILGTLNVTFTNNPIIVENPNGGELKDKITTMGNAKTLRALKVTGKMSNKDWNFVMSNLPLLEMFDISATDVTDIPESAFKEKQKLATVHLPTTVITIHNSAFYNCPLLDVVDGCENVQEIGSSAFSNCPQLSVFPFGNKIRKIESYAFYSCTSLPETLIMSKSFENLGWSNVFNGSSIRNFDLSLCTLSGSFADNAFGQCTSLLLPEKGSYQLDNNALTNAQLSELRLPAALSAIYGSNVLPTTLQRLYVSSSEPINVNSNVFNNIDFDNCTLYVPVGALDAYSGANVWANFTNIKECGFKVMTGDFAMVKYGETIYKNGEFFFPPVGEDITLQILPVSGYEVDMLKVDGQAFDYSDDGIFTIPATITGGNIEVTFDQKQLQMAIAIEGNGSFTINNDTYTEAATTLPVKGGDVVTLALQPSEGYFVKQVIINGEDVILKNGGLEITTPAMDVNTNIAITFSNDAESIAIVTFEQEGFGQVNYGNVSFEDASTLTLVKGKSVELEFVPSGDSNLQALKVNGTDVTTDVISNNYTLNNVTVSTTVSTTFFSPNMIAVENPNGGELKEMIAAMGSSPATIRALKVIGKMSTKDWNFVKGNLPVLEEFDISETDVKFIPEEVFSNRNSLTTVHLPSTLTVIQNGVFRSCSSLTVVDGCENVQEIGSDAFEYCTQLSSFPFGDKIKTIESYAFYGCTALPEKLVMPASLKSFGWGYAFNESSVRKFDLSQCTLTGSIGYNTFGKCTSLLLPEKGDYQLGSDVFRNALLTELRLPAAVSAIYGDNVMPTILERLYISRTEPFSTYKDAFKNLDMESCTLYVPIGSKSAYEEAEGWMNFTNIKEYGLQVVVAEQGKVRAGSQTLMGTTVYFPTGESATFEIHPIAGWHTESVINNDAAVAFTDNKFTLSGDQLFGKLAVAFAANQFNLQLQIAGSGQVKLGSLVYTANQTLPVDSLATLNFTLEPAAGQVVSGITFNGKESVVQNGGTSYVTPAITANSTLVITFGTGGAEGNVATYAVKTGEGGSVEYKNTTLLPETTIQVAKGVDAVFTIIPDEYYIVDKVLLDDKDVSDQVDGNNQLIVKNVNADAVLQVTFRMNAEFSVVLEDGGNLSNMLSEKQKQSVTKLTIKGQIQSNDFYAMRDEMPLLSVVDLWEAETDYIPYQAFCITAEWWESSVGKRSLTSVRLPKGTHRINSFAFAGCSNLKDVNFAELTQLEYLEGMAFAQTNLSVVDLSKTKLTDLDNAFYQMNNLESIKFPQTLTSLGSVFSGSDLTEIDLSGCSNLKTMNSTFSDCKKLVKVTLPESITSFNSTFNNCQSLTTVNFPKSLQSIGGSTFYNTKLQKVDLSGLESLTVIGNSAFSNCDELTEVLFPGSLEQLGGSAFSSCDKLTSVDLSNTQIQSISGNAFSSCGTLESVKMPRTLETIDRYAFAWDYKLSGVLELPATTVSLGEYAFSGTQISIIKSEATTPPVIGENTMNNDAWVTAFVPEGYADVYKSAPVWEDRTILDHEVHAEVTVSFEGNLANDIVEQTQMAPPSITHLKVHGPIGPKDYAIMNANMTLLYDLDLEDAECSIIPENALMNKKALMNVKLPKELLVIQENAFRGCSSLKGTLTLPEGVTTIGWAAFQGCSSLEKVELSDALEVIRGYAFEGCSALRQEIHFPQSFTSIGEYAFANCRNLTGTVKFNDEFYMFMGNEGYWSDTGYTFENCSSIEAVDMSACENLYQLPNGIFRGCTSLQTVQLPPYLERIEYNGFEDNTNLSDIEFPSSLMYIDGSAFRNCASLQHVDLSDCEDFATIGEYAFANCASLESVNLPASLNWINSYAFSECRQLEEFNVEALQPADLGDHVFYRVHTDRCVLSIPTGTYSDYLSAPQWGAFVQMRKAIDVSLDEGAALTYSSGGEIPSFAKRRAPAANGVRRAPAVESQKGNVNVKDGSSLYVAENENVTFFINPEENVSIKQVLFNGEDVTDQLQANAFVTPGLTENASFKVLLNVDGPITVKELRMLDLTKNVRVAESAKLTATIYPTNATNKKVLWSSGDEKVATVAADGTVIGVAAGRTTITAKTEDGGFEQKCELVVMSNDYYITLAKEVNGFVDNTAQVPMSLHNAGDAQGIQFDVYLPEGLTMRNEWSEDYGIGLSSRSNGHRVTASRRSDGSVRVVVYSTDGKKFRENDGELLSLPIGTRANVGDYDVEVKNIHVSGPNSFDFSAPDYKTRIHVADYPMGDSNGNGEVTVADATNTVDHILERYTERFIEKAADVNTDGVITVSDVTAAIDIVLERPASSPMRKVARISAEPSADNVYIDNVSMANGQQQTIDLKLTNKDQYIAFQCDIMLPEGLTAATNEKQVPMVNVCGANAQTHVVQADYIGSGALRLIVMSMSNSAFAADDNNVVSLTVEANSNVLGQKDIDIQNVRLVSVADHTESVVPDTRATINIVDPATGFNSIASGKNLQVTVEGREIVIVSDSDTTVTLAALGGTYRTLQVKAGENRFVIEQPGVYVLQGRKIIIK